MIVCVVLVFACLVVFAACEGGSGTLIGVAGLDYCVMAADRMLTESMAIKSDRVCRLCEIDDGSVLFGGGELSDYSGMSALLKQSIRKFHMDTGKATSTFALSHLLSNLLYSRRFQPYSSSIAVGGLDSAGRGSLYGFDSVGSFERVEAITVGAGGQFIQPMLDRCVANKLRRSKTATGDQMIPLEEACEEIIKMFRAAKEREISIGDHIDMFIVRSSNKVSEPPSRQPIPEMISNSCSIETKTISIKS